MTDEELIARLRDDSGDWLTDAAADRIEALVKYRDAYAEMERIATEALRKSEARAERLEAAIRELRHLWYLGDLQVKDFSTALKGDDHEWRRYMGQIMAECDCSRQGECEAAQECLAVAALTANPVDASQTPDPVVNAPERSRP